ncbi:MAG: DUF362 domain-containing protein [Candidatus Sulfobium sp.]|jgi:uncharacterized protein (DUF362 family)/Pyruvate/2-oxoacid:ferredoxin oxidoreductase delta subunit
MSKVVFSRSTYKYESLRPAFFDIIDSIAGGLVTAGSRVVIKPNLLAPARPASAMLTHPSVVRAAVEYVLEKDAKPVISDSPAMGSFGKVLETSGIRDALGGLDVVFREFKDSRFVEVGEPFKKIEVASDALDADLLINLPKLKTHSQMLLTLGVKNLYGCIVGLRKPEWHLKAGVNREMFARLLVEVYRAVGPTVTIMDGILAMEGEGPGKGGTPRQVGALIGSLDAVALDFAVCRMLGLDPYRLLTNRAAREMGLADEEITVEGDIPRIDDFRLPEISPLIFGPPQLHGFMRRHLVQRPVSEQSACRLCGECWKYCPAGAIKPRSKRVVFDYDKCIRCYCCVEVCPHGAIGARETLPGRVLRKALGRGH